LLVYNSGSGLWNNTRVLSGSYTVTGTLSASAISASTWYGLPSTTTNPGGVNTNIQFNSGSTFSGSNNLTYNYTTSLLAVTGNVGLYAGTLNFAGNSANFNFADDSQILVTNDNSGDLIKVTSPSFGGRSTIDIGNLTGARDLTVNIQGIADDYLNITIPTSGTTAQFTSVTGTLNGTASYALNADLFDGRNSTTFASTGSNIFVGDQTVTGSIYSTAAFKGGYNIYSSSVSIPNTSYFVGLISNTGVLTASLLDANNYPQGQTLIFKDVGGYAGTNNILIKASGSQTIDGASGVSLTANSSSVTLLSNGSNGFYIIGIV